VGRGSFVVFAGSTQDAESGCLFKEIAMLTPECTRELRTAWLPNITDAGLDHLIDLLEKGSPLLIHGSFTRAIPMGCLATHIAWHHPTTANFTQDAGICWLNRVAGLNPATSHVIREWDRACTSNWEIRADLMEVFKAHRASRQQPLASPPTPVLSPQLVEL
jgi:hypothetical protein